MSATSFQAHKAKLGVMNAPELDLSPDAKLISQLLREHGFAQNPIQIFNHWTASRMSNQVTSYTFPVRTGIIRITNVVLHKSTVTDTRNQQVMVTPQMCRLQGSTYGGRLIITARLERHQGVEGPRGPQGYTQSYEAAAVEEQINLGDVPIMLGSESCHLYGKTAEEKIALGEDPNDPLGYYIINGTEKSVITQENLRASIFFAFAADTKGTLQGRVTCPSVRGTSIVVMAVGKKWQTLKVKLHHIRKGRRLPVYILFAFLGVDVPTATNRILSFIEPKHHQRAWVALNPSQFKYFQSAGPNVVEAGYRVPIGVQDYMMHKRDDDKKRYNDRHKILDLEKQMTRDILRDLFSNVPLDGLTEDQFMAVVNRLWDAPELLTPSEQAWLPVVRNIIDTKASHLAMMTARMVECLIGVRPLDDRDSWSNKKLESAGRSQEQLLGSILDVVLRGAQEEAAKDLAKGINSTLLQSAKMLRTELISANKIGKLTTDMRSSFSSKSWGVRGTYAKAKENVTEILQRDTPLAVFSQAGRINTPTSRKAKQPTIRMLVGTSIGLICPAETPEGESIGLVKNKARTLYLSIERSLDPLRALLLNEQWATLVSEVQTATHPIPLLVNGVHGLNLTPGQGLTYRRWCIPTFDQRIRAARRSGYFPRDVAVLYHEIDRVMEFWADSSRCTRPLLVVQNDELVIDTKRLWGQPTEVLLKEGALEYLDSREAEWVVTVLAQSIEDVRQRKTRLAQDAEVYARLEATYGATFCGGVDAAFPTSLPAHLEGLTDAEQDARFLQQVEADLDSVDGVIEMIQEAYRTHLVALTSNVLLAHADGRDYDLEHFRQQSYQATRVGLPKPVAGAQRVDRVPVDVTPILEGVQHLIPSLTRKLLSKQCKEIRKYREHNYSHSEIHASAILGDSASAAPQGNSCQGPRLTYQASMGKQALSGYHYNHHRRFDTSFKVLLGATRPLFETEAAEDLGLNIMPAGTTPIIAIMALTDNNEDGIVAKREYLDNGNFEYVKYVTHKLSLSARRGESKWDEQFAKPEVRDSHMAPRYHALGEDGIPRLGAYIRQNDCIIGRVRTVSVTENGEQVTKVENASIFAGIGGEGYVDRVIILDRRGQLANESTVMVKIRQTRKGRAGDKFASRYAMKGTLSVVKDAADLPRVATGKNAGLVPDFFIGPESVPSRMVMNKMKETLSSLAACIVGERVNGSTFRDFDIQRYIRIIAEHGYSEGGEEEMVLPSGHRVRAKICVFPCYYQALRHHVLDKIQMRSRLRYDVTTHQPVAGRSKEGGLRAGEMERDAMISQGTSGLLLERLMYSSDMYRWVFCSTCETDSISSPLSNPVAGPNTSHNQCRTCSAKGQTPSFGVIEVPYILKVIISLLRGLNFNVKPAMVKTLIANRPYLKYLQ